MSQNTSHAVMAQRVEPHDSLDFFPTPPWATRALCEALGEEDGLGFVLEPACGQGHMAAVLEEYADSVVASDIHPYGYGACRDYLLGRHPREFDWVITNPPFRLAEEFVLQALENARQGVAVLVRTAWLEGGGRWLRLFDRFPPSTIMQFCERVPMVKGRWDPKASSATSYCWVVWYLPVDATRRTEFAWIEPGRRKDLTKPNDIERFTSVGIAA